MSNDEKGLSRREFLVSSAGAAAALSLGWGSARAAEQPAGTPANVEPIKFGIIGSGSRGGGDLQQAIQVPGAQCVAVCDVYPPSLANGLKIAKGAESYTDYRKMLERKDIQAVMVCTPLSLHAPMTLDALSAGKHVFVEKTMAWSVDQCRAIVKRQRETKLFVQVGHQRHYSPLYHHALDQVKQGIIGEITAVRAFWNRNGNAWWRNVPPQYEAKFGRLQRWRLYKEYSGGLMTELACHQFDAINWFLGTRPLTVQGVGALDWFPEGKREVYDNVHCIYTYPNKVKVTYESLSTSAYDGEGTVFLGRKGTLVLSETSGSLFFERGAEKPTWTGAAKTEKEGSKTGVVLNASATTDNDKRGKTAGVPLAGGAGHQDTYYLELADFFDCIRHPDKKKPFADAELGLQVGATVLRANDAMAKGTTYHFKKEDFEV